MTVAWHALAATVVAVGLAAQVFRPLVPDVGMTVSPQPFFDAAYIARAAAYRGPLEVASVVALALRVAVVLAFAITPVGRRLTGRVADRLGRRPALAATVIVVGVVVMVDVLLFPLSFWARVIHDGTYGLRTQSPAGWVRDWLFHVGPVWLGVAVMTAGGYVLAQRLPRAWPAVAGSLAAALGIALIAVSPLVLEPLEHTVRPLDDGPVKDRLSLVTARAGMGDPAILVADASRRSVRQNAYVSGLGPTRRIVLYDTLVAERTPDEVAVIVAHELAHRRNHDGLRGAALSAAGCVIAAYTLAGLTRRAVRRGTLSAPHDPRGAPRVVAIVTVLLIISLPIQQAISRRAEAAADAGALEFSNEPQTAIDVQVALTTANLGRPAPPAWVHLLWGSHPTPVERLTMAARWQSATS